MDILIALLAIAVVAGIWQAIELRQAKRREDAMRDILDRALNEQTCRDQREKQLRYGVTPITSRTPKRSA